MLLIAKQFLLISTSGNDLKTVWRIYIVILGMVPTTHTVTLRLGSVHK